MAVRGLKEVRYNIQNKTSISHRHNFQRNLLCPTGRPRRRVTLYAGCYNTEHAGLLEKLPCPQGRLLALTIILLCATQTGLDSSTNHGEIALGNGICSRRITCPGLHVHPPIFKHHYFFTAYHSICTIRTHVGTQTLHNFTILFLVAT